MAKIKTLADSAFMERLVRLSDDHVRELANNVRTTAKRAADLLDTVVKDMPLYTLHNERHVLNVLGWMESLLTKGGIQELSPLECALCILAAYTHDLGMTLSERESDALSKDPDYLRFRDRFLEERQLIERLRNDKQYEDAHRIENHLRTEYIRNTHADLRAKRLSSRLQGVAPHDEFLYEGFEYRNQLKLVAVSHNQPVEWLRQQFEKERLPWRDKVGHNETVNFILIGLLLRLADIMDLDASRTPAILFRHLGLDRELAHRFTKISSEQWMKHLAITGVKWPSDDGMLIYRSANCPHPVVEKTIREFVGMIGAEVNQAAGEMRNFTEGERKRMLLPASVTEEITPVHQNGRPAYTYHDWHFRLDQEEILQLLMGESLYGEPGLCIRELLQNALDAVELRDLRLRLRSKGGQPVQPVDGELLEERPGWFVFGGRKEELAVSLTWGEEAGRQFIRVEDNGTGMTQEIIERHFTQIGKSFYRGPDFRGEQAEMRLHHLICTPISTFGIGVLSCFMIADRILVRTNPGAMSESRPALDLEISGPGSLFWTRPGTRTQQGTEVTLWLRHELRGKPVRLIHDKETCFKQLRESFGYSADTKQDKEKGLDPGLIAAEHVVWPKYPIHVCPPGAVSWSIDDRFHVDKLAPISCKEFVIKLAQWEYPREASGNPHWELIDWVDDQGDEATGTRIRLWRPTDHKAKKALKAWELAAFTGPQTKETSPNLLIQSMRVSNMNAIAESVPLAPGVGWRVWIDLRGAATPKLTADRGKALIPAGEPSWQRLVTAVYARFIKYISTSSNLSDILQNNWQVETAKPLRSSLPVPPQDVGLAKDLCTESHFQLIGLAFLMSIARGLRQDLIRDPALDRALTPTLFVIDRDIELVRGLKLEFDDLVARDLARDIAVARTRELARDFDRAYPRGFARMRDLDFALDRALDRALGGASVSWRIPYIPTSLPNQTEALRTNLLQEAFLPDLQRSWPGLGLQAFEGKIGDAILIAPAIFHLELDGRRVLFADQQGAEPVKLTRYQYDLCFPMTAIPLGRLRQKFPQWREDRYYRPLGVLPFLFPDLGNTLTKHSKRLAELFSIGEIYAFRPALALWYKKFDNWIAQDWKHPGHFSLLWDIPTGTVLVANGVHSRDVMRQVGKPFIKQPKT